MYANVKNFQRMVYYFNLLCLELAIDKSSPAMVQLLLKYGARPNYLKEPVSCNAITATAVGGNSRFYEMPLDQAKKKGNAKVIALLKQRGAKSASCANRTVVKTKKPPKQKITNQKSARKLSNADYKKLLGYFSFNLNQKEFKGESGEFQSLIIPVSPAMRQLVLQHEKSEPTPNSPSAAQLARCGWMAARVEIDVNRATSEWVMTTKGGGYCETSKPHDGKPKTFWLVQQKTTGKPAVLASGRGHSVEFYTAKNKKTPLRGVVAVVEDGKLGMLEYTRCFKKLKKSANAYKFMDESATKYVLLTMANTTMPEEIDMSDGSPCLK